MTREVAKVQAGEIARLDVIREGKERFIDVRTALRPSEAQLAENGGAGGDDEDGGPGGAAKSAPGAPILGMELAPLGPTQRQEFNLAQNAHGVVVQGIKGSSDASDKGMQRGDVIVRAGDREVASTGDVAAAVDAWRKAGRKEIPLAVSRGGRIVFLPLKIDG
jgi:serine protease Do